MLLKRDHTNQEQKKFTMNSGKMLLIMCSRFVFGSRCELAMVDICFRNTNARGMYGSNMMLYLGKVKEGWFLFALGFCFSI